MSHDPIVDFSSFSYRYSSRKESTLKNINLQINRGEKILIAGPSGCGKTTIGNCLNGLIPHAFKGETEGGLQISGLTPSSLELQDLGKIIGTVLQDTDGQFVGLSVGEDIAFALENDALPQKEMQGKVKESAALVAMEDYLSRSPFALSGGQKQRVSLAGILVDDVDLLLFDEPLANLDPKTGEVAIQLLDEIHKKTGKTIVIIEHRLEEVLYRSVDRIILVEKGQIIADAPPDQLLPSTTLAERGIREPLYLEALKRAGCQIKPEDHPASLETLNLTKFRSQVLSWFHNREISVDSEKKEKILQAQGISYSYEGEVDNLKDISFHIDYGERVSLLGENGAGKSTLAKTIMGLLKPDKGRFFWKEQEVTKETIAERSRKIGFVMQNPNHMISQHMIFDEVALGLVLRGEEEKQIRGRVEETLKICGLYPFRNWPVEALSYGQKKRVTIASILVMEPKLLIMDEPTAGQDYRHYTEFMQFITELNKNTGLALLMVTHDLHLALEYTQRSLVLSQGKIIADGPVPQVFADKPLLEQASLKTTSLYRLAQKLEISAVDEFIHHFIHSEQVKAGV